MDTLSGAATRNDEYFSGPGIVIVVPEPSAAAVLFGGFSTILGLQRFHRQRRRIPQSV